MEDGVEVRRLGTGEAGSLEWVAEGVFDLPPVPERVAAYLEEPGRVLVVALDGDTVVGFVSAAIHARLDGPPELYLDEVAVAPTHEGRGIGRRMVREANGHGRAAGCRVAWVMTEPGNASARRMYAAAGGVEDLGRFVMVEFDLSGEG